MPDFDPHVVAHHNDEDYHEMIPMGRIKVDSMGRLAPRRWSDNATRWVCNNVDCPAEVRVSDWSIRWKIIRPAAEAAAATARSGQKGSREAHRG